MFSELNVHVCIAGLERNLRLNMEKHEELKVVEAELYDLFLQHMYVHIY